MVIPTAIVITFTIIIAIRVFLITIRSSILIVFTIVIYTTASIGIIKFGTRRGKPKHVFVCRRIPRRWMSQLLTYPPHYDNTTHITESKHHNLWWSGVWHFLFYPTIAISQQFQCWCMLLHHVSAGVLVCTFWHLSVLLHNIRKLVCFVMFTIQMFTIL